jgi:uncharacterized membrane protein YqjE
LGEDLVTIIESKLGLLKVEVREDATAYVRGALALAVGGLVAAIGFALLNIAFAFLLAHALTPTYLAVPLRFALGFVLLGVPYLLIGIGLVVRAERRVANVEPLPEASLGELEKDRAALAMARHRR